MLLRLAALASGNRTTICLFPAKTLILLLNQSAGFGDREEENSEVVFKLHRGSRRRISVSLEMWKRGGRSTALERAEALLMTRKRPPNTDTVVKCTSVPPKALTSDLNDPSGTWDSEEGVGIHIQGVGTTGTEKSVEGGRSRFLKKAPTSATFSQSPGQRRPKPSSQSSALSQLAQTENHIPRSKQNRHDLGVSAAGTQSAEAATVLSAQFSPDQSLNRRPFLKNTATGSAVTADPQRNRSGATTPSDDTSVPVVGVKQSTRVVGGFSLESDEEDMKRLLAESESSTHHTIRPSTAAPRRTTQKRLNRQSHKVIWSSGASVRHPSPSDPSPPPTSPFGWTGPAQIPPSPGVLSPSLHRPFASPSPPESLVSTYRKDRPSGPQRSLSSTSRHQGALSLEELFPVDSQSNNSCSERSSASSEDFKINVMGLDDLGPGFTEETREKKLCGFPDVGSSDGLKEEEEVLDYHSDFDPVPWTESSTSQISEHILGEGEEEELGSEVRENAAGSRLSWQKTEYDHTGPVSDTSPNCSLRLTSAHSQNTKASGATRQRGFTEPHGSKTSCPRSQRDGLGSIC